MNGVRRLVRLGGPVSLQAALSFSSSLVSLAFAGHLGGKALGQAVLALSLYNISAASVVVGLAQGLETLCSQARSSPLWQIRVGYQGTWLFSLTPPPILAGKLRVVGWSRRRTVLATTKRSAFRCSWASASAQQLLQ